jgi:hypothetical protein
VCESRFGKGDRVDKDGNPSVTITRDFLAILLDLESAFRVGFRSVSSGPPPELCCPFMGLQEMWTPDAYEAFFRSIPLPGGEKFSGEQEEAFLRWFGHA